MHARQLACSVCCFAAVVAAVGLTFSSNVRADPESNLAAGGELRTAIREGDTARWTQLLAAKADPNARDERGNTALHFAALRSDAEAVDALLQAGADAAAANAHGATPLHYGIGSERIVKTLLAHGAPVDPVSKPGLTPLLGAAARTDSFAVVRLLVEAGANVNREQPFERGPLAHSSVLALAVTAGNRETIRYLLDHRADPNPKTGTTPLIAAAYVGDLETTKLLLARGADINYRNDWAGAALNFALQTGHDDVARYLVEHGADVNSRSSRGHATPPLLFSAYRDDGSPAMAQLLLGHGADVNIANDYGETALSYAMKCGDDTALVHFLRDAGAKPPALIRTTHAKTIPTRDVPTDPAARAAMIRDSAQRAVDLLERNSTAFLDNGFVRNVAQCVSCHQQALPAATFGLARQRGLRVDDLAVGHLLRATVKQREASAENARELDEPTANPAVTLGFDLQGMQALGYAPDDLSDALTHYLIGIQRADGSWPAFVRRPPIEDGIIDGTAWAIRAVQLYPPRGETAAAQRSIARARAWLAAAQPQSHTQRVFQLLGLAWAGDRPEQMKPYAAKLIAAQQTDGGWPQLATLPSDAWATGSTLVALNKAGIPPSHRAYQRGVEFLLRTQFDDGSWLVRSRTWPFQPHFDGQFPHGKDQWISAGGTAFAAMALLLTLEPTIDAAALPNAHALMAKYDAAANAAVVSAEMRASNPAGNGDAANISFSRDIKPLVERSCAGCHVGEKVRGNFSLASRDSLLRGGQSGDRAVVPGRAAESPLLRYVSDEIEDLEMPPLSRREKYPPLSAAEIALLKRWIEAGAAWDEVATAEVPKSGEE